MDIDMDIDIDRTGPVVVGVDPSDCAHDAVAWAADLAAAWGAPLHLVHVVPQEPPVTETLPWLGRLLGAAERGVSDPPRAYLLWGNVVDVLADHAAGARLLVLGSYGVGASSGMLAGSTGLALVGRAGCPVVVVRGLSPQVPPTRSGPVVVGADDSPAGRAALALAADLAVSLGAPLIAVRTWSQVVAGPQGATRRPEDPARLAAEAVAHLGAELDSLAVSYPDLSVQREVVEDTPVSALLDRSDGARLLVVGHRGCDIGSGMLSGSTSRALVGFARCPVVVTGPATESGAPVPAARSVGAAQ
jgi:nucleotide-binding universal stress UspA family protein